MLDDITDDLKESANFWKEKAITQLSFFNNLLMTVSLGLITLAFKDNIGSSVDFVTKNINCSLTFYRISFLFLILSVIIGIIVAFYRLFDFRFTRNIAAFKVKYYKKNGIEPPFPTRNKYKFCKRTFLIFNLIFNKYSLVIKEEEDNQENIEKKLNELRDITDNIGNITWTYTICQIATFIIGLLLFAVGFLSK